MQRIGFGDAPNCGKCGLAMTPQDAKIHPELFLHDACLPDELRPVIVNHLNTAAAMREYGGSFVRCLGELWSLGYPENRAKLEAAFAEYFAKYKSLAERRSMT